MKMHYGNTLKSLNGQKNLWCICTTKNWYFFLTREIKIGSWKVHLKKITKYLSSSQCSISLVTEWGKCTLEAAQTVRGEFLGRTKKQGDDVHALTHPIDPPEGSFWLLSDGRVTSTTSPYHTQLHNGEESLQPASRAGKISQSPALCMHLVRVAKERMIRRKRGNFLAATSPGNVTHEHAGICVTWKLHRG